MPLAGRVRLAAEILAAYAVARRQLRRGDLAETLAALRDCDGAPQLTGDEARAAAFRLAGAARRTLRLVPADSRCLMRSLVVTRLLARRGIATTLVIAARVSNGFGAHAWVEVGGRPVLDPAGPPFERLVEL
jgi:hypothetical protein